MLELQNICYRVSTPDGEQDILKDISITIPDHKLMVFTGAERLGWTIEELMEKTILAMRSCEERVNKEMEAL